MPRHGKSTANKYILTEETLFRPEFSKFPKFLIINLKKRHSLLSDFEYPILTRLGIWLSFYYCLKELIPSSHPNQPSTSYGRRRYRDFENKFVVYFFHHLYRYRIYSWPYLNRHFLYHPIKSSRMASLGYYIYKSRSVPYRKLNTPR